jgi:DNA-binding HxlR family transcriptional regulator
VKHKDFSQSTCPIARGLDLVGEWWSMMILRDAFFGATRFDQFQKSLDIAPGILTRRLATMVEAGLLERRLYSQKPPRHDYVLTERGRSFFPVLAALSAWTEEVLANEDVARATIDRSTGVAADLAVVDRATGKVVSFDDFLFDGA